jgi:hypothetical protein
MERMHFTYAATPILKSKPKDQRSIIADVLLASDRPLTFAEIVAGVRKARYDETLKQGGKTVTIEESVQFHLGSMTKSRTVAVVLNRN